MREDYRELKKNLNNLLFGFYTLSLYIIIYYNLSIGIFYIS